MYILVVMVTVQQNFLAIINAVMMVNDCWPEVILSAYHMIVIYEEPLV